MAENEETTAQESGEETTEAEQQPVAEEESKAEKKPAAKAEKEEEAKPAGKPKAAATKTATAKKSASIDDIMDTIKNMTVLELSDLVKALESEFGVSAAAPMMATAPVAAPTAAAPAVEEEEKTEFNVILKEIGANKISVIRAVRELTSLGLKESKDLVESAPKPVKEGVNKDDAAAAKQKLEEAGATAEIT